VSKAQRRRHVLVVGAGAFGGWTAGSLLRLGARVTLVDAWGPGNSRASSGGETRVIRATYGPDRPYVTMVARAFQLWREHEQRWQRRLLYPVGVLWMVGGDDAYERASLPLMSAPRLLVHTAPLTGSPPTHAKRDPSFEIATL
jgi:glycine/D-amino acid oxidase-like deaminating enzyme